MVNWKTFKIIGKEKSGSSILFRLDDYVCYKATVLSSDECFILCYDSDPFNTYRVGEYLQIDLDKTRDWHAYHTFCNTDIVKKASSSVINLPSITQNQVSTIVRQINSAIDSDERNRYTASIEVNPETGNVIYKLSGERK